MKTLVKRTIDTASVEELKQELKRRELASKVPEPLKVFNMAPLIALCKQQAGSLYENTADDDMRQYIYEAAMMAIYGPDFWVHLNKALRDRKG